MTGSREQPPRILLLAGDVRGNMGDRAIRAALCAEIRKVAPAAELFILSRTPERDAREFGACVLGRSPLALLLARGRRFDFCVWGGGQLLQDDSSLAKNAYWAAVLLWVRCVLGLPILGCSLGVGPISRACGRFFARYALRQLTALIGRDDRTVNLVHDLAGPRLRVDLAPDLAWFLPTADEAQVRAYLRDVEGVTLDSTELVIGVAVRRWFHLREGVLPYAWRVRFGLAPREDPRFTAFLDNLADGLRAFARGRRVRLLFFPMASADWEGDAGFARRIGERSGLPFHILRLACDASLTRALTGCCSQFVSVRMHSALMALSMEVPTVALYHVSKVRDLLVSVGLSERAVPLEQAAEAGGAGRIAALLSDGETRREEWRANLRVAVERVRAHETVYLDGLARMIQGVRRGADRTAGSSSVAGRS